LVLGLCDLPLEVRDQRGGARQLRLRLTQVERGGQPGVEAVADDLKRPPPRRDVAPCGLELDVELAEPQVSVRDVADQRHRYRAPRLLAGQEIGPGGLAGPSDPAPDV